MVLLFGLAVLALVVMINYLVLVLVSYNATGLFPGSMAELNDAFAGDVFVTSTFVVCLVIMAGSAFKIVILASGGHVVAESLGGNLIPQNSQEASHRKILNVVEEMAIASGSPVPSVYLLDEESINAFAAGWRPADAVIGITRGALDYLSRDELQGVIAHEFSHIYNGDMRLNIRLMGVLNGILLLGMIGYYLMRMLRYTGGRSNNRDGGSAVLALMLLGLGLTIIGYVGTFFGNWIKAIISRQREYLADASAVQFTRNRDGIAGALKKIGALSVGSRLTSPAAHEYSHAYFSMGVGSMLGFLFATHPPLKQRISRIDPRWDGEFVMPHKLEPQVAATDKDKSDARERLLKMAASAGVGIAMNEALNSIEQMGQPHVQELGYARDLLNAIPDLLKNDASDPYGVRALIYCLVISKQGEVREKQWQRLREHADTGVFELTQRRYPLMTQLHIRFRLPLMDLSFPALRTLSVNQYQMFRENLQSLIDADQKVDLSEWIIQRFLLQQLDEAHGLRKPSSTNIAYFGSLKRECELLLSLVAYAEHRDEQLALQAFTAGIKSIGAMAFKIIPRTEVSIKQLDAAMDKLDQFKPLLKKRVLVALVACVATDAKVTVPGLELLRTIASCLHCPLPALQLEHV